MKAGGHTLVQLLVAMTLASLLLGAFATVNGRVRQAVSRVESLAAVQDTLTQAMAYLGNDLRQAGYLGLAGDSESLAGVAGPQIAVGVVKGHQFVERVAALLFDHLQPHFFGRQHGGG